MSTQIRSCFWEKMQDHSEASEKRTSHITEFQQSNEYTELYGTDREPVELEWNIFLGFTTIEFLERPETKFRKI